MCQIHTGPHGYCCLCHELGCVEGEHRLVAFQPALFTGEGVTAPEGIG